jgi:hypothetical protein
MGLRAILHVYSVVCDKCGGGMDTMGEHSNIKEQLESLHDDGWKGNYKNLLCPKCVEVLPKEGK